MIALSFAAKGWASPEPLLLLAATAIAISAALGDSTRSRREFVEAMAKRAEHAEHTREAEAQRRVADERLRIARDLHDTVAHEISVISLNAGVASSALASNPERSEKALATIRSAARGALAEIGELLHYLRDDSALDTAPPRPIVESLPELVARLREGGLAVTMNVTGPLGDITGGVGVVVYRIIQEGLTNAHKHGDGCSAHVTVAVTPGGGGAPGTVHIHIENPVRPPTSSAPHGTPVGSGLGLLGIRERVSTLRGHVSAGQIGAVWVLDAVVPWQRGE